MPQKAELFQGTVRSNLTLGMSSKPTDEDLWQALEIAQAADFVSQKEGGLDATVEAFGWNFSGGQRQRLTIARAVLRRAPFLVLDDATSALDYLTEARLLQAIKNELTETSLVLISQRTNSLRSADQILVLDKGEQVALGRHEELLISSAIYREIHNSQHSQGAVSYTHLEQLEAVRTDKTKVLVLNSPSNPTGMIYTAEELLAIGNWAVEHDVLILADDIYGRLVYNGNKFTPISSLSEAIRKQTVVINGVSKSYSMTGWRIGYAVGEPEIIAAMSKVAGQTTSNPTTVAQYAAIEALTGSQETVEIMRQAFEERLNTIYPLLAQVPGFEVIKPQGAFYPVSYTHLDVYKRQVAGPLPLSWNYCF